VEQREAVRNAAAKVEAVLSPGTRDTVSRLRERIRISQWMEREPSPWLPILQQAVVQQRVVRLRYHSFSPDEITERKVEPHGLVYYGNDWHMVGYCRLREALRDFRASRILDAELLPDTFERLNDFVWFADDQDRRAFEVRVWLDGSALPWAREATGFGFEREEQGEGGSVFVFQCRDLRRLLPWVLSFGAAARVISPTEVAERVREEAAAMMSQYGGP
jgi:predicted DNA-binding transcriptional regulator YafY